MADQELLDAALAAQRRAYAPYSGYAVGAAIRDEQGRIHAGCNVENISFGVTLCAERCAIGKMISEGGTRIGAVLVVTRDGGTPCGMCLQALAEFCEDPAALKVYATSGSGDTRAFSLAELLPYAFRSGEVTKAKHI